MDFKVTIEGLEGLKKTPQEIEDGLELGFKKARLHTEGVARGNFKGHAQNELYVRSGHLRRAIYSKDEILGFVVGAAVIYARVHQFGGRAGRGLSAVIPARPYIKINEDRIAHFLIRGLDKKIKDTI